MDMESDMGDGDMGMLPIFRPMIIIHLPLLWPLEQKATGNGRLKKLFGQKIERGGRERSRKNESAQGQ